jgi:hypothetical protein
METATYRLPEWTVAVHAERPEAFDYLDSFLDRASPGADAGSIDVTAEWDPGAEVREFGFQRVRHQIRSVWHERLVATRTALNLHASAVDDGETVVAFVGERFHGKTTLLLDMLAHKGGDYVTNDNLLVYLTGDEVMLSTVPTYLKVRTEPAARFEALLAARAAASQHGAAMWRRYRADPAAFPFHSEMMLPPAGFGRLRQPIVALAERRLVLVDVDFATAGPTLGDGPRSVAERRELVTANLKWSVGAVDRERLLVDHIVARAEIVRFRHTGTVDPLLSRLRDTAWGRLEVTAL